jgi:glutamine---fructose-6-phosphate transaminase (isomerizing)
MARAAGTLIFAEAAEAPAAVARQLAANREAVAALAARLRAEPPRMVTTLGRGSSDHAATFAKYLIETRLGIPTASTAPSVASVYGAEARAEALLCLALSQSGRSPDLLAGVQAAKQGGAITVALVNDGESPLAAIADHVLPLHAGPERSVAATKSFIATLAAIADLVGAWAGDEKLQRGLEAAPSRLKDAWEADWSPLAAGLTGARGLYVVARGLGLAAAQEAALKLKETCGLHAEAFSAAELRHGPLALVGPDFPVLVLRQSDETEDGVDALLGELAGLGAPLFVTGAAPSGAVGLPAVDGHPAIEPMLRIQSFYRAAIDLALARGFDPDRPPHLRKVTETV